MWNELSNKNAILDNFWAFFELIILFFCLCLAIRTSKRPVPLEHCLFYSGEFYKVCENESFIPQGLRAAKDTFKKKSSSAVGGSSGRLGTSLGSAPPQSGAHFCERDNLNRGKMQKHSGPQAGGSFSWAGGAHQHYSGSRRSEASLWLLLINKLSKKSLLPVCEEHTFWKFLLYWCLLIANPKC